jgi:hypothetical protein
MNRRAKIWRINYQPDDAVGGAVVTGTVIHWDVPLRMEENPQQQLLLQQGLETQNTFRGLIIPGTMDIRERDELEVTSPRDDMFYGQRFRIVGMRYSNLNPRDPRNYAMLQMVRSVRAHEQQ